MADDVKSLEPFAIIGFDGSALKGLRVHPGGEHVVYPMGNKVCVQEWRTKRMAFLSGHTNSVATVAVSPKGTYVGSGQINHIGFKASTKLWDFHKKVQLGSHDLHKVRVEALAFTCDERYLVSIGGRDDGCVVLYDCVALAATGTAAATKLTTGDALCLAPLNCRSSSFITGGEGNLRLWNIHPTTKALEAADVGLGKLRRTMRCLAVAADDGVAYAGTTTGDIIKFSVGYPPDPSDPVGGIKPSLIGCLAKCGKMKHGRQPQTVCYSGGVEAILILSDGCLVVGGGDGTIELIDVINWSGTFAKGRLVQPNVPHFRALKSVRLSGSITSLELLESPLVRGGARRLLAGTRGSEVYSVHVDTFHVELVVTCPRCAINDVAFPKGMSGVFATGGAGDIRVWSLATCQELLRVLVPNMTCSALLFAHDGKSIVSAWNDACIRAFTPLSGRLMYCILNTHNKGASALDMTRDGRTLISGGCEGQVRLWDIKPTCQTLKKVLKEHKSPVSAIRVSPNDLEAVSAGTDGSCIIWDLVKLSRRQVMYSSTLFMCVSYEPRGCQLLTGGTDRRVAYWEVGSGNLARELEASKTGAINGLDINSTGDLFVTGGNDQFVKIWKYQEGIFTHTGLGHAGAVTCCKFSPDTEYVVSCCAAGSIIIWRVPEVLRPKPPASARSEQGAARALPPLALGSAERHSPKAAPDSGRTSGRAAGDAPRLPAAPSREERIERIDTHRSSVQCCCPCGPDAGQAAAPKASPASKGKSPKELPTRTTSTDTVRADGDKK